MLAPLPLAELLAILRGKGLPIGLHEHRAVGRLLLRWDDPDTASLKASLAALLARNSKEAELVRSTFDELYAQPAVAPQGRGTEAEMTWRWQRLAGLLAVLLLLALAAWIALRSLPEPVLEEVARPPVPSVSWQAGVPPPIEEAYLRPAWGRLVALGGAAGLAALLGFLRRRRRREGERRARRAWRREADALSPPAGYKLVVGKLSSPFSPALLDALATLLGRSATARSLTGELDVERTVEHTLRAGLAPQLAFRERRAAPPVLVLEDVGDEMHAFRFHVAALLAGLAACGTALDRWRFHSDARRVFRSLGDRTLPLARLLARSSGQPLLVISTGEGVLEGRSGARAPWVAALAAHGPCAWLQPAVDRRYWRPALHDLPLPVYPLTAEGLLAAVLQITPGRRARPRAEEAGERVAPLDVERLRWLLSLSPQHTPEMGEALRQRFCPHVSRAALLEALDSSPLDSAPGVGPAAGEVHAFLFAGIDRSEPAPGSAAHGRWRLDRALQGLHVPARREAAIADLAELARGPLAAQVEEALQALVARAEREPAPSSIAARIRRAVLQPLAKRARQEGNPWSAVFRGWSRPGWRELAAGTLIASLTTLMLSWAPILESRTAATPEEVYRLRLEDPVASGTFSLHWQVIPEKAARQLVRTDESGAKRTTALPSDRAFARYSESARGAWFYLRDREPDEAGRLRVSNRIWVPEVLTIPPVVEPPARAKEQPAVATEPGTSVAEESSTEGTAPQPAEPSLSTSLAALSIEEALIKGGPKSNAGPLRDFVMTITGQNFVAGMRVVVMDATRSEPACELRSSSMLVCTFELDPDGAAWLGYNILMSSPVIDVRITRPDGQTVTAPIRVSSSQ